MLKLYGSDFSTPLIRVRFGLNAMGIEYEYIRVALGQPETKSEEYLTLHPAGKVPAIDDDGFKMFESNAIMKYLGRKYNADFYPDEITQQAQIDQWIDFTSHHLGSAIGRVLFNRVFADMLDRPKDEQSMQDGYNFIKRFMPIVDAQLGKSKNLAAEKLTIADLSLLATLDPAEVCDIKMTDYPNIKKWREQLMQESFYKDVHDSYEATLEKGRAMMSS